MPGRRTEQDIVDPVEHGDREARRDFSVRDAPMGRERFEATKRKFEQQQYTSESTDDLLRRRENASNYQAAAETALPPTPPLHFHDNPEDESLEEKIARDHVLAARSFSSGVSTPLVQRSPPTPETTPPRAINPGNVISSPSRNPSIETHAESFQTAREELPSEDEAPSLDSPPLQLSRQQWLRRSVPDPKPRGLGLGLGLESGDEESDSGETTPVPPRPVAHLSKINGEQSAEDVSELSDFDGDGRKRRGKVLGQLVRTQHTISTETARLVKDLDVEYAKHNSFEKRRKLRRSPDEATLQRFAQEIQWPVAEEDPLLYSSPRSKEAITEDAKRESSISTRSSVVEAVVIPPSTPTRRQTLRRTSKVQDFGAPTPPTDRSDRSSSISGVSQPRTLRLRHASSPDAIKRHSLTSRDLFTLTRDSVSATQGDSQWHRQPHEMIHGTYRSSRAAAFDQDTREALRDAKTAESLSRPTTAPEASAGYFDVSHPGQREISTPVPDTEALIQEETPRKPVKSRLFAEVSPAATPGKVTMEVNEAMADHRKSRSEAEDKVPELHDSSPPEQVDRPTASEWNALRPCSALVTPFSLRSAQSSTPGTLEVNEATAVSIYPHTNRSILVVQQMSQEPESAQQQPSVIASNANFAISAGDESFRHGKRRDMRILSTINGVDMPSNGRRLSFTGGQGLRSNRNSAIVDHVLRRPMVDSPLKNPRVAPTPPDLRLIAATPRTDLSSPPHSRNIAATAQASRRTRFSQPLTAMRRSLSARRFSDTIVQPLTRGLSLSNRRNPPVSSMRRRRESLGSLDAPQDNLHPFWRPRGFWNDLSDEESEADFGNSGQLTSSSGLAREGTRHRRRRSLPFTGRRVSESDKPHRSQSFSARLKGSLRLSSRTRDTSTARRPFHPTTEQEDNPFSRIRRRMSTRVAPSNDDIVPRDSSRRRHSSFIASSKDKFNDLLGKQNSLRRKKSFEDLDRDNESYEFITTNPSTSVRSSKAMALWPEDSGSRPVSNGQIIDSYARRNLQHTEINGGPLGERDASGLVGRDADLEDEEVIPRQGYPVEYITSNPVVDSFSDSFHNLRSRQPPRLSSATTRRSRPISSVLTSTAATASLTSASSNTATADDFPTIPTSDPDPSASLSAPSASDRQTRRYSVERRNSGNSSRPPSLLINRGNILDHSMTWGTPSGTRPISSSISSASREPSLRRSHYGKKDETVREMVKRMTGVVLPPTS